MISGYVGVFHANTLLQQLLTSNENSKHEQARSVLNTFKKKEQELYGFPGNRFLKKLTQAPSPQAGFFPTGAVH